MKCKNCDSDFEGKYCSNCGQKDFDSSFTVKQILRSAADSIFDIERGFLFTMKALIINPGTAVSEYISGKRVRYSNPFKYLLVLVTIYAVCTISLELVERDLESTYNLNYRGDVVDTGVDPEKSQFLEDVGKVTPFFLKYINFFQILVIPLISVFSYLFFKKAGYNFAENIIFNTYLIAQGSLIGILFAPLHYLFPGVLILSGLQYVTWTAYYVWACVQFFRSKSLSGILKSLLTFILGYASWYVLVTLTLALYLILDFFIFQAS